MSQASEAYPICRYLYAKLSTYFAYGDLFVTNDLLESVPTDEKHCPTVLSLRCGDIRSCFYTLWKNFAPGQARFNGVRFVLSDKSSAVLARNILLLYLTVGMPDKTDIAAVKKWLSAVWAIWFCHELQPNHEYVLKNALGDLIGWSSSEQQWLSTENPLREMVAFASKNTRHAINQKLKMWHKGVAVGSVEEMKEKRSVVKLLGMPPHALGTWYVYCNKYNNIVVLNTIMHHL